MVPSPPGRWKRFRVTGATTPRRFVIAGGLLGAGGLGRSPALQVLAGPDSPGLLGTIGTAAPALGLLVALVGLLRGRGTALRTRPTVLGVACCLVGIAGFVAASAGPPSWTGQSGHAAYPILVYVVGIAVIVVSNVVGDTRPIGIDRPPKRPDRSTPAEPTVAADDAGPRGSGGCDSDSEGSVAGAPIGVDDLTWGTVPRTDSPRHSIGDGGTLRDEPAPSDADRKPGDRDSAGRAHLIDGLEWLGPDSSGATEPPESG